MIIILQKMLAEPKTSKHKIQIMEVNYKRATVTFCTVTFELLI